MEQPTTIKQHTIAATNDRKRKFLLALPFVVFPFVTLMLWSVGLLGNATAKDTGSRQQGFNTNLPAPVPAKDSTWNKLRFYEQADKEASRFQSLLKDDPYSKMAMADRKMPWDTAPLSPFTGTIERVTAPSLAGDSLGGRDANEEKVYRKLEALNAALNRSAASSPAATSALPQRYTPDASQQEAARLQAMMTAMQADSVGDPEMDKIDNMLEKILDIQHPERIREKIRMQSALKKNQVFPVYVQQRTEKVSFVGKDSPSEPDTTGLATARKQGPAFFSLDTHAAITNGPNAIRAVIDETKEVVSGGKVRLRLLDEVYIQGRRIPKNTFVFGRGVLNEGRLLISVTGITYQDNIMPVDLSVYDTDGMPGLDVNSNMVTDVARQSTDQAIQQLSIASLDPSIGAQAASAGIQAAKSLIGKKTKVIKVTVRAGHGVLLKDNNVREY